MFCWLSHTISASRGFSHYGVKGKKMLHRNDGVPQDSPTRARTLVPKPFPALLREFTTLAPHMMLTVLHWAPTYHQPWDRVSTLSFIYECISLINCALSTYHIAGIMIRRGDIRWVNKQKNPGPSADWVFRSLLTWMFRSINPKHSSCLEASISGLSWEGGILGPLSPSPG